MTVEYFDCEQGSPEWIEVRRGIPSASRFKDILAKGEGKTRATYMRKLAAERFSGQVSESYTNAAMDRGKVQEPKIRSAYAFLTNTEPKKIGFARRGVAGCSPDALIGEDGLLEIKSAEPHILFEIIEKGVFPSEHKAQALGGLWVTERLWCDIAIGFFPDIPPPVPFPVYVKRIYRDDVYLTILAAEVERFDQDVAGSVEIVNNYIPG